MIVTLIGKQSLYKLSLPKTVEGNYWITNGDSGENEIKLLNIQGKNDAWEIVATNNVKVLNKKDVVIKENSISVVPSTNTTSENVILKEYEMYYVVIGVGQELFVVYCYPSNTNHIKRLKIGDRIPKISIGSSQTVDLSYAGSELVKDLHASIAKRDGNLVLENFDERFGTFVNNEVVTKKSRILKNGDIIFMMGLKMIVLGDCLLVDDPRDMVTFRQTALVLLRNPYQEYVASQEENEEEKVELYTSKDYFFRAPRIKNVIEHAVVKIDSPPNSEKSEEVPAIVTYGASIMAGVTMVASTYSSMSGMLRNDASLGQMLPYIFIAISMLASMILLPILVNRYHKKSKKEKEEKRQQRYKKYIDSKVDEIYKIRDKQRKALFENYLSPEECAEVILNRDSRLWERKVEDYDFLTVRLGIGDVPLDADIHYPEERFTMDDDNLMDMLTQVGDKAKTLKEVPITISLVEKNVTAVISEDEKMMQDFIKNLLVQLVAFQSYEDLKLVFLLKDKTAYKWDYVKRFPHVWTQNKQLRFFASDYTEMQELSKFLLDEYNIRSAENPDGGYKAFHSYYLVITDDLEKAKNLSGITEILKSKTNAGFSFLFVTSNIVQLPNECKTFITLNEEDKGELFESEISSKTRKAFMFNHYEDNYIEKLGKTLSNIPIKVSASRAMLLPNSYTFLEMYQVGRIEQLNIQERWAKNDPTISLRAPIGIDGMGAPILLDIHEKQHGPHGLIAGSTGSGKSEFIITYILSLAINYHPDDVAFLLIDYKGGGLAGAFKKKDVTLPHLVGTITNIETAELQRSLDSIQSELRRRQVIFNEARNLTNESTIDIYKYQKLYHEGVVTTPIPHLLIICDEFAELKQQQPDFMDELISVARIGRSLGVHLILATQKPAGIVNDQIRSNSRFGICLKVQDREDSMDVIKRPDAVSIKKVGQFFMQVGNNEYFVLGQSGWSGALYFPTDIVKKEVDNSITFITNTGNVMKRIDTIPQKKVSSNGDQLTNVVNYICEIAANKNIAAKQLWCDNIPANIYANAVKEKYHLQVQRNVIAPLLGEYDDPYNQMQGPVVLNFDTDGNTIVFGNASSGKETLLSPMVYEIMTEHTPEEAAIYILDFGSEALKIFNGSPSVGDIVLLNEKEKISRLFEMLQKEIRTRKEMLVRYNGDYNLYLNTNPNPMPRMIIVINNYEAFVETYEFDFDEIFQTLTREGLKFGINFVITVSSSSGIRYRLLQNFKNQIALQLNNQDEYLNIFDNVGKKRPSHIFGRGLVAFNKAVYEFQTAKICDAEQYNDIMTLTIERLSNSATFVARKIPTLPAVVKFEMVADALEDIARVPIGIDNSSLGITTYDFSKNIINIICAKNLENTVPFVFAVLEAIIRKLRYIHVGIFDVDELLQENTSDLKLEYRKFLEGARSNPDETYLGVIMGFDKFIGNVEDDEMAFNTHLSGLADNKNCTFIIVEGAIKLKNHAFESWYQNYARDDMGIWVGNGINDQYTINLAAIKRDIQNNCGNSFGYVVNNGEPTMIKLLGVGNKDDQ